MPELPEVEVIRRGLIPLVTGRMVEAIRFSNKRLRYPLPRAAMRRWLIGARCTAIERRGKNILLFFDDRATLVLHLGMSGRLYVLPLTTARQPHEHCRLDLEGGTTVRFIDPRRFGSLRLVPPGADWQRLFVTLGPEPLAPGFSGAVLQMRAGSRRRPIKNILMDGRIVAGIGNIYACEILHAARIAPSRPACELTPAEWRDLAHHIQRVLLAAIEQGGTTIADFADHNGRPGYFQLALAVYGRAGEPCPVCGSPILRTSMAGRATFFCGGCQR